MNLPGFTAEVSLYKSSMTYFMNSSASSAGGNFVVQPQLRKTDFECVHDCLEAGGPSSVCNFFCTENIDDGGGRSDPVCRPSCSPCRRVPGQAGRWRTCILRNCDDRMIRCA